MFSCSILCYSQTVWEWKYPSPSGNYCNSIAYGNNQFVAVGDNGTIITSPDGINWKTETNISYSWRFDSFKLVSIAFGKNMFKVLAVNDKATHIFSSDEGKTWTEDTAMVGHLSSIAFCNNQFVAVGYYDAFVDSKEWAWALVYTSSDGKKWTCRCNSYSFVRLNSVSYGNYQYVSVGDKGELVTSSDGIAWIRQSSFFSSNNLYSVIYANNAFIAVGKSPVLKSADARLWTEHHAGISADEYLTYVTYLKNKFIALSSSSGYYTSTDGEAWVKYDFGTSTKASAIALGNNGYVAVGNSILTSSDCTAWKSSVSWTYRKNRNSITYGKNQYITVEDSGGIASSSDGSTWTSMNSGTSNRLYWVTYGNGIFVAVGFYGTILTSLDGITWSKQTSATSNDLYFVIYSKNQFIAVGDVGAILTSPDGTTWTIRTSGIGSSIVSVAYCNNQFIAIGKKGECLLSFDGTAWTPNRERIPCDEAYSITYGNGIAAVSTNVSNLGNIFTSTDGKQWICQYNDARSQWFRSIIYENNTFVAVGTKGFISTSKDGKNWKYWESYTKGDLNSVVFGDNQFLACGENGAILGSIADNSTGIATPQEPKPKSIKKINSNCWNNAIVASCTGGNCLNPPTVAIFNGAGKKIYSSKMQESNGTITIPSSVYGNGVYIIRLTGNGRTVLSRRFFLTK